MGSSKKRRLQAGAIPYRIRKGKPEVLLITSRTNKRWIIPKGNNETNHSLRDTARMEAFEEAGVKGDVKKKPIGRYEHGRSRDTRTIEVYLLHVEKELRKWPESSERKRTWMSIREARKAVEEKGLRKLLKKVRKKLSK